MTKQKRRMESLLDDLKVANNTSSNIANAVVKTLDAAIEDEPALAHKYERLMMHLMEIIVYQNSTVLGCLISLEEIIDTSDIIKIPF